MKNDSSDKSEKWKIWSLRSNISANSSINIIKEYFEIISPFSNNFPVVRLLLLISETSEKNYKHLPSSVQTEIHVNCNIRPKENEFLQRKYLVGNIR